MGELRYKIGKFIEKVETSPFRAERGDQDTRTTFKYSTFTS